MNAVRAAQMAELDTRTADLRGRRLIADYVREGRARRVSWAHLAKQLGKSENDLKTTYGRLDVAQ